MQTRLKFDGRNATIDFDFNNERHSLTLVDLLKDGDDNAKLQKSNKLGKYRTWSLSLAPATVSGRQTCPRSSPGCRTSCIFTSGHAQVFPSVNRSRVARTLLWFEFRDVFEKMLKKDLEKVVAVCRENRWKPVVRLNTFSDLPWEKLLKWIFHDFPQIQYYDYSKILSRVFSPLPENYDLTFSRSETNDHEVKRVLESGGRVCVVYRPDPNADRDQPVKFVQAYGRRYRPACGDRHDLRFLDPPGVVLVKAKGRGRNDESGFVVPAEGGTLELKSRRRERVPLLTV